MPGARTVAARATLSKMNPDSLAYVESLYAEYLGDPSAIPAEWRRYFDASGDGSVPPPLATQVLPPPPEASANGKGVAELQDRVDQLIRGYRVRGHLAAQIDPLGLPRPGNHELELASYGLSQEHLEREVSSATISGEARQTLRSIVQRLQETYCR